MFSARTMSVLSLFGLTYNAYNPEINIDLDGKAFQSNTTRWIQMTCMSNKITSGCTAEFLTNQKSYDHLRGVNNQCYHSGGSCSKQLCTCYDDCKQFTLNITSSSEYSETTFGCTVIVEVDHLKYKATTVLKSVQNGFELFNKEIIPLYVNKSVQETTMHPPSIEDSFIERIVLVIAICTGIICTLSVITVGIQIVKCYRRKPKQETRGGDISVISFRAGKNRLSSSDIASNTDSGFSSISNKEPRKLLMDTGKNRFSSSDIASNTDSEFSSISNAKPRKSFMNTEKELLSFQKQHSEEDIELSSILNIRSSRLPLNAGQLFSIGEDIQHERETPLRDSPSHSEGFPDVRYGSCSRKTQSPYTCNSPSKETEPLFNMFDTCTETIRDPWIRPNSCTLIPFPDSDA